MKAAIAARIGAWARGRTAAAGRIGIAVGPEGYALTQLDAGAQLVYCEALSPQVEWAATLAHLVEQRRWQHMACSLVLHPSYYQLLLTEAPKVADAELAAALRWKIKDLIDYPVAEAAVAAFRLPADAYRGRQAMAYCAVLRKCALQELVQPIEQSGLMLDSVEIAELAIHKLAALAPTEGGLAQLHLLADEGFINLVAGGQVYLSRRLDVGIDALLSDKSTQARDQLLLEIQRSLDFYESQLGKGIISQLYFSPMEASTEELGEFIASRLGINVRPLPLPDLSPHVDEELPLQRCVMAIGAALKPQAER